MIQYNPTNIRTWSRLGSCGAFGIAANEMPQNDDKFVVLTADLCYFSGLERFKAAFPDRLYNCGIAEQNMVGIAAGLAKEGYNPFVTTYATFATMRCADQVRVNMGYMRLPIKIVGLTAGFSVGILGATHISIEDIAVMRAIPGITILSPADSTETIKATIAAAEMNTPIYIRLTGTMNNPIVYQEDYMYKVGKAITLRKGRDIALIATGTMVYSSLAAAEILSNKGIDATVINMHTINPLDTGVLDRVCEARLVVTVEEHSVTGGLGGAVAEHLAIKGNTPQHMIIGIKHGYPHAADYDFLLKQNGLMPEQIADTVYSKLTGNCKPIVNE